MLVDLAPYRFTLGKLLRLLDAASKRQQLANVTSGGGQIPAFRVMRPKGAEKVAGQGNP